MAMLPLTAQRRRVQFVLLVQRARVLLLDRAADARPLKSNV
jgi:hypothetical protein